MKFHALYRDIGCGDGKTRSLGLFATSDIARNAIEADVAKLLCACKQMRIICDEGDYLEVGFGHEEVKCIYEYVGASGGGVTRVRA